MPHVQLTRQQITLLFQVRSFFAVGLWKGSIPCSRPLDASAWLRSKNYHAQSAGKKMIPTTQRFPMCDTSCTRDFKSALQLSCRVVPQAAGTTKFRMRNGQLSRRKIFAFCPPRQTCARETATNLLLKH